MRTIYEYPRRRTLTASLAILAVVVTLLGFAGVAAQSRSATDAAPAREATHTNSDAPAPTPYFPSQFEFRPSEPEPHIQAF